ncbi:MAG: thioredoxin family protein [Candidatus Margulisiibacteriota bacterium]
MEVIVYGPGCARCAATEKNVREALKQLGKKEEVKKISDVREFAKAGIVFTPAVVIDGEVKVSGKIPSVDEIKALLVK